MINEFDTPEDRTKNFIKHSETMRAFSIANIVRAYDYINLLSQFVPQENEVLDDKDEVLEPLLDVIRELQLDEACRHCESDLFTSDLPQYDAVCVKCGENF